MRKKPQTTTKRKVFLVSFKAKGQAPDFSMTAKELKTYIQEQMEIPPVNFDVTAIRVEVENQE